MFRKFYEYARHAGEPVLTKDRIGVFRELEDATDLYKANNSRMLQAIKDCNFNTQSEIKACVDVINAYLAEYELETYGELLNKSLVITDYDHYITKNYTKKAPILRKIYVEEFANKLDRAAFRFIVLGAYNGIGTYGVEDLTETNASGINLEEKTITVKSGYVYKCDDKLLHAAVEAANEDSYVSTSDKMLETVNSGKIVRIKAIKNGGDTMSRAGLYNWFNHVRDSSDEKRVTLPRLYTSGFYNKFVAILNGRAYTPEIRPEIEHLLADYNKTGITDTALSNMKYYSKAAD